MSLAITSFTPTTASTAGGTVVTITGTALDTVDLAGAGELQGQIVGTPTTTTLVLRVPAQPVGPVKIFVADTGTSTIVESSGDLTYAVPTDTSAHATGASKFAIEVDTSVAQDGSTWTRVRSITKATPGKDDTTQDTSTFDDVDVNGRSWKSQAITQSAWTLACDLLRQKYAGSYDAGQETLRLANETGDIVHMRWYDRTGGPEAYEGFGQVTWAPGGGGTADLDSVTATVNGNGARITISNPAA